METLLTINIKYFTSIRRTNNPLCFMYNTFINIFGGRLVLFIIIIILQYGCLLAQTLYCHKYCVLQVCFDQVHYWFSLIELLKTDLDDILYRLLSLTIKNILIMSSIRANNATLVGSPQYYFVLFMLSLIFTFTYQYGASLCRTN